MTNTEKFTIITIGFYKAANIVIDNTPIPYSNDAKLLGLTFKRNNFYVKQVDSNVNRARAELKKNSKIQIPKNKAQSQTVQNTYTTTPHISSGSTEHLLQDTDQTTTSNTE